MTFLGASDKSTWTSSKKAWPDAGCPERRAAATASGALARIKCRLNVLIKIAGKNVGIGFLPVRYKILLLSRCRTRLISSLGLGLIQFIPIEEAPRDQADQLASRPEGGTACVNIQASRPWREWRSERPGCRHT